MINSYDTLIIKRIIGLPGDNIEYRDNKLYINDKYYKEDYLDGDTITSDFTLNNIITSKAIPDDYYFVLGDNREESKDSRLVGLIHQNQIEGKAKLTLFPFARFGNKK